MTTPVTNDTKPTVYGVETLNSSAAPKSENALGKDTFLKLLVAQLKYQDPMKPSDPQSFLAQTAQFTQVEKLEEMNKQLEKQATSTGLSTASALLGRKVTFALSDGTSASGVVASVRSGADGVTLDVGTRHTTLDQVTEISNDA